MFVCVCVYLCVMYVCICGDVCVCVLGMCVHVCVYTYVSVSMHLQVCMGIYAEGVHVRVETRG